MPIRVPAVGEIPTPALRGKDTVFGMSAAIGIIMRPLRSAAPAPPHLVVPGEECWITQQMGLILLIFRKDMGYA